MGGNMLRLASHSRASAAHFELLQERQAQTRLSPELVPPRFVGMRWSTDKWSRLAQ